MSEEQQEQITEGSGRKLVYKAVIDSIEPIEGADRIEVAKIKGWRVVVGKGEFVAGEVVLFFEVDSALNPWDLRYEFLKERCYKKFMLHGKLFDECLRLRTIRLRGVYSQGLIMKTDLFCEVRNKKIGEDCTAELAVRHYDEVAEKAVRVMEHAKPGNAKGLFPSFLIKSDEERVQNLEDEVLTKHADEQLEVTEKKDGCVLGTTFIDTNQGKLKINTIVEHKMPIEVLSWNEAEKRCEYKPIVAWHRYRLSKPMVRVYVGRRADSPLTRRTKGICCTTDHLFYTSDGWKPAGELTQGTTIYFYQRYAAPVVQEMLLGCLLGDSSIAYKHTEGQNHLYANSIFFNHGVDQLPYLELKKHLLGDLYIDSGTFTSGYGSTIYRGHTVSNPLINELVNRNCMVDGKKHITESWMRMLTPISLAFWYQDDGCVIQADPDAPQRPYVMLQTQRWSEEEVDILINMLNTRFGIIGTKARCNHTGKSMIRIGSEEADTFFSIVAPYIHDCMKYKVPEYFRQIPCVLDKYPKIEVDGLLDSKVIKIEDYTPDAKQQNVFDLEVADNHNYFANGVLIHNSSCTIFFAPSNRSDDPFGVCSRNYELKDEGDGIYWKLCHRFDLEHKLPTYCQEHNCELALQGEIIGPGVNGNHDSLPDFDYQIFRIWDIKNQKWLTCNERYQVCKDLNIPHVPVLEVKTLKDFDLNRDKILLYAEGYTAAGHEREGVVFKSIDGDFHFKAVSNRYLLSLK